MSSEPISVIIPTYNRAHLVSRAIESALSQLSSDDELIVIDDGSTDGTSAVVSRYEDRLRYVCTENRGPGAARNRGLAEARNPIVSFLDSDDEWLPNKTVAVLMYFPSTILWTMNLGPLLAITHRMVTLRMRALASAILFFILNLIGLGLGPQTVGVLNDILDARFGDEAVRYSLLVVCVACLLSGVFAILAGKHLKKDLEAQKELVVAA